jgi:Ni2+-binding GTPase involved in maturation of urease and hydrogenase
MKAGPPKASVWPELTKRWCHKGDHLRMSRFETSLSSGEVVVEVGGDNRCCNAGSAIIETRISIVASLDAHVGLIDTLLS